MFQFCEELNGYLNTANKIDIRWEEKLIDLELAIAFEWKYFKG